MYFFLTDAISMQNKQTKKKINSSRLFAQSIRDNAQLDITNAEREVILCQHHLAAQLYLRAIKAYTENERVNFNSCTD